MTSQLMAFREPGFGLCSAPTIHNPPLTSQALTQEMVWAQESEELVRPRKAKRHKGHSMTIEEAFLSRVNILKGKKKMDDHLDNIFRSPPLSGAQNIT